MECRLLKKLVITSLLFSGISTASAQYHTDEYMDEGYNDCPELNCQINETINDNSGNQEPILTDNTVEDLDKELIPICPTEEIDKPKEATILMSVTGSANAYGMDENSIKCEYKAKVKTTYCDGSTKTSTAFTSSSFNYYLDFNNRDADSRPNFLPSYAWTFSDLETVLVIKNLAGSSSVTYKRSPNLQKRWKLLRPENRLFVASLLTKSTFDDSYTHSWQLNGNSGSENYSMVQEIDYEKLSCSLRTDSNGVREFTEGTLAQAPANLTIPPECTLNHDISAIYAIADVMIEVQPEQCSLPWIRNFLHEFYGWK